MMPSQFLQKVTLSLLSIGLLCSGLKKECEGQTCPSLQGCNNSIPSTTSYATVGGGSSNAANENFTTVGGGQLNIAGKYGATVGGGVGNTASSDYATVAGGSGNIASNVGATIAGGVNNLASGHRSWASGFLAQARHHGAWVWSDISSTTPFASTGNNQFNVRAAGGIRLFTNAAATVGVRLLPNDTGWDAVSAREVKEDFQAVDRQSILAKVQQLPITTWRLKGTDGQVRHVGPVAQDFHAAFAVGADARYINSVDADGVALAAIQALAERNAILAEKNTALERQVAELQRQQGAMQAQLSQVLERLGQAEHAARSTQRTVRYGHDEK
jgi:DNA-binding transcriptional MerR regulator